MASTLSQVHADELSRFSRVAALARQQNVLNAFEREERMRSYRAALADADWHYELASGPAHRDGRRQFVHLYELQAEVDPTGEVWRAAMPQGQYVPQPRCAS
jgi:hypothetical protein